MKTIKYISILVLSACMAALSSCAEEDIVKKGTPGDGHTLLIELTADANREISPLSKASADDPQEKVTDLNILIYQNGSIIEKESQYITSGEILTKLSQPSTTKNNASAPFTLTDIEPGAKVVYVVANAGKSLINDAGAATADNLKNYKFGMNGNKPQFVMFAEGQSFDVSSNASITSSLKRIYSMVTVKMKFDNLSSSIQIIPLSLQLKHIPVTGQLKENNKISSEQECLIDGEKIEKGNSGNFLLEKHSSATPLFLYENRQPEGKYLNDERTKTPAGFPEATAMSDIIKTDRKCSYIEIVAKYIKSGNADGAGSGTITYRFFLGENATNNFDVQRNYHYKVTLSLTGNGGKDEATWRVEADLKKEMSIQDVYIGYRQGATTILQATGDFADATVNVASDSKKNIKIVSQGDGEITVEALSTNTHDFEEKTYYIEYKVAGSSDSKRAKVIQVPRLVDPIAIFKSASNVEQEDIVVKQYNDKTMAYESLKSVGPWSATILEETSDWFTITDANGNSVRGEGATIHGEGEVVFKYKPVSPNPVLNEGGNLSSSTDDDDKARYGVILVKYHNERCEHKIFVRQGYHPTKIKNVTWNMLNCIGKDRNNQVQMTEYPTQTPWFFVGGNDLGLSPYNPGYRNKANIECSDGSFRSFENVAKMSVANSREEQVRRWNTQSSNRYNGPCPKGYKVASSSDVNSLLKGSEVYVGYVHDDDPNAGYSYLSDGEVELENNNSSNPAKGALFVSTDGKNKTVFFSFGKGAATLEAARKIKGDGYRGEIGVGHRAVVSNIDFTSGLYAGEFFGSTISNPYEANYWTSSYYDTGGSGNLGRVNMWYDITANSPYKIDLMQENDPVHPKYQGWTFDWHGCFVRCVRK